MSGTDAVKPSECAVNSLLHWKGHFIQRLIITAYNSKTSSVLVSFSQSLKTIFGAASRPLLEVPNKMVYDLFYASKHYVINKKGEAVVSHQRTSSCNPPFSFF